MPNALINETSPYLLQHANNPVDWFPWGNKALEKAAAEDKMLLISIGYAACHWCHVMEHESFEDPVVAKKMNDHFLCIKVDREERPDVDQIYMNAAHLINGNGGWPLNAIALPDGRPFFAATYFPKDRWLQLLDFFSDQYKNNRKKLEEQAQQLSEGIADIDKVSFSDSAPDFEMRDAEQLFHSIQRIIDPQFGGLSSSMKFPMPSVWKFLLHFFYKTGEKVPLKAVESTLINMAQGGIFDQIGGGFSRYSIDNKWHVPHFEKMLYDNAQLIGLYSQAFQITGKEIYKSVVEDTIEFVKRELTSPENGFYASIDADSEKEEGKFYVWSYDEVQKILKDDADLFCNYYGITKNGNWEQNKNIPDIHFGTSSASNTSLSPSDLKRKIKEAGKKLLLERQNRVRPATDDKILTSWNAMMAGGLISAYRALDQKEYLEMAKNNLDFLLNHVVQEDGSIFRNYKNGKATIHGFLDDYAFLIKSLSDCYQSTFDIKYLEQGKKLLDYVLQNFINEENKLFYYTDKNFSDLISKSMEIGDNVMPSSNSMMAHNLHEYGILYNEEQYEQHAATMLNNVKKEMKQNPAYYSNWAQLLLLLINRPFEVAIMGTDAIDKLQAINKEYLPNVIFMGGATESLPLLTGKLKQGQTLFYVCHNRSCQKPVSAVQEALAQIKTQSFG